MILLLRPLEFVLDGREGVEQEIARVSHDGGAARSDFITGEEFVELAEGAVDGDWNRPLRTLGERRAKVVGFR